MVSGGLIPCKRVIWRSCVLFAALWLQACAATYSAKPITATVVDAETGEPLEGVNVVAHWVMNDPAWRRAGDLELMEAVTNKEGKFHIPGWGPKGIPSDLPRGTRLGNDDPGLILFKSGYKVDGLSNMLQPNRLRPENDIPVRYSDWDGKVIRLEKFKGDLQFYGPPGTFGAGIECPWKKVPRFFVALMQERARLDRLGVRSALPTLGHLENSFRNSGCGSAEEFFREYMP
jgi:hypothetical protein